MTVAPINSTATATGALTLTVNAVGGVATFSNLTLTTAGTNYTLQAQTGGFAATSPTFAVSALPASQLVVTTQAPYQQATATVQLSGSAISSTTITSTNGLSSGGSGYTSVPTVTFTGGGGSAPRRRPSSPAAWSSGS